MDVCINDVNGKIGKEMTATEVLNKVMKDKMFYDTSGGGLTVTGGAPTYLKNFTLKLLRIAKDTGISLTTEACGMGLREYKTNTCQSLSDMLQFKKT